MVSFALWCVTKPFQDSQNENKAFGAFISTEEMLSSSDKTAEWLYFIYLLLLLLFTI